jgi:hypothetical protein
MGRRPSPALVVALIALFAALGGSAVALSGHNSVRSDDIRNGQVKPADLQQPKVVRVKANPLQANDPCEAGKTAVFCGHDSISGLRGWQNLGEGYAPAAFFADGYGVVHLSGTVVQPTPGGAAIFILPKPYRPAKVLEFAAPRDQHDSCTNAEGVYLSCNAKTGTVRVSPNGYVQEVFGFEGEGVSLDGISYPSR